MTEAKKPAAKTAAPKQAVVKKEPKPLPPVGSHVQTENFNLNVSEQAQGGAPLLNVARIGWVGPAQLVVHASLLDELIEGLQKLRNAKAE